MNEENESFSSTETWKRRRHSRFRYSSKQALKQLRMTRRTAKAGGSDFTTIIKALLYPSALSSEISITDHHD
jgi:hypothetical protein